MKKIIHWLRLLGARRPAAHAVFANVAVGTHAGRISRRLDTAVAERNLLGKQGSAADAIAPCSAADMPLGAITDSGSAGELVSVSLLGNSGQTQILIASAPITAGSAVCAAANGRVQPQPQAAGTYYEVGIALTAASAAGQSVEVATHSPRKLIVLPAFSGTPATDIAALTGALEKTPDKIRVLIV